QTENHTSLPALLNSGCTTRFAPSPSFAHSAIGSTLKPPPRLLMSNTATDWLILASGLSGVSMYKCFDCGCVLMKSEPPPWPFSTCTGFQAYCGCPLGSVPIKVISSAPKWLVAHTGPYFGCTKFAPRPGCGILP